MQISGCQVRAHPTNVVFHWTSDTSSEKSFKETFLWFCAFPNVKKET